MKLRLLVALFAVAGFVQLSPRASADFVLDNFNTPSPGTNYQITLLNANPYTSPTDTISPGVNRTVTVTVTTPVNPAFNAASGTIGGGLFSLDTANDSKVNSRIRYDLSGSAQNLSLATGLVLDFETFNAGNLTATTAATDIPLTVSLVTSTGTRTLNTFISGDATLNFSSFSGTGNMSQVSRIDITLNNTTNSRLATDFALDKIVVKAIPAPPAVLLAGVGVLALIGRARLTRRPVSAA
jgi:hypothetical protein